MTTAGIAIAALVGWLVGSACEERVMGAKSTKHIVRAVRFLIDNGAESGFVDAVAAELAAHRISVPSAAELADKDLRDRRMCEMEIQEIGGQRQVLLERITNELCSAARCYASGDVDGAVRAIQWIRDYHDYSEIDRRPHQSDWEPDEMSDENREFYNSEVNRERREHIADLVYCVVEMAGAEFEYIDDDMERRLYELFGVSH